MTDERSIPQKLDEWNEQLSAALGVPLADVDAILELAGVAAHSVVRPAAPLTTFLVGYSAALRAAAGVDPAEATAHAIDMARDLAQTDRDE